MLIPLVWLRSDNSAELRSTSAMRSIHSDIIDPVDLILVFEDFDGHKAVTLESAERRICDPCWKWSGVARLASWTGGALDRVVEPNLCQAHRRRFLRGSEWDGPLQEEAGRPREQEGVCALEDCGERKFSRGLCRRHYQKDYRSKRRAEEESR